MQFGQKVTIKEKYDRKYRKKAPHVKFYSSLTSDWRVWETEVYIQTNCIFLGYRYLKNGIVVFDPEEGPSFNKKEQIKVALVCPGKHLNPIYVPLDAIEAQKDDL